MRCANQEGRSISTELRSRMANLEKAAAGVDAHRATLLRSYSERLQARMSELFGAQVDKERILQEVAVLVDRSDIQEELVRLHAHVKHFLGLLDQGGEVRQEDGLLTSEMNREANTMLSKTSGLAGEALKVTEMGLLMKSEIEKSRERFRISNEHRLHCFSTLGFWKIHVSGEINQDGSKPGFLDFVHNPPAARAGTEPQGIFFRFPRRRI